jgi:hypothetical protein
VLGFDTDAQERIRESLSQAYAALESVKELQENTTRHRIMDASNAVSLVFSVLDEPPTRTQ